MLYILTTFNISGKKLNFIHPHLPASLMLLSTLAVELSLWFAHNLLWHLKWSDLSARLLFSANTCLQSLTQTFSGILSLRHSHCFEPPVFTTLIDVDGAICHFYLCMRHWTWNLFIYVYVRVPHCSHYHSHWVDSRHRTAPTENAGVQRTFTKNIFVQTNHNIIFSWILWIHN